MKLCTDCKFLQPYDAFVRTPMCGATNPRHFTELQRLPTGECGPDAVLWEARG